MKLDELSSVTELLKTMDPNQLPAVLKARGINIAGIYQELEMNSRFVDTHRDVSFGNSPVQLHSHSFYEMIYCESNSGVQYLVGTKRYSLLRGDIILVPPGVGHRPLFPAQLAEPYKRIVLWFSTEFIEGLKLISPFEGDIHADNVYLLRTAGTSWENIGQFYRNGLLEAQEKKGGWQHALVGNTIFLLTQFWRALDEPDLKPLKTEKPELLDEIVSFIEGHLQDPINLKDTATLFYVSESTISQSFKKNLHVSFYHYVTQRRLIAAKSMILTEPNLEDLSLKVGFSDYSTFFRAFKKEFGISPREYRKLIAESQGGLL